MDGKNGIASMIQVSATSTMERDYLYQSNNSLSNFFKKSYKQHSYFDKEPLMTATKTVFTGQSVLFDFDKRRSDMMGNLVLRLEIPTLSKEYVWANDIGPWIIDYVTIVNGDRELATYKGLDLLTHHALNTTSSHRVGMSHMLGHYNTKYSLHERARTLYVPIPFMRDQFFPTFLSESFQIRVSLKGTHEVVLLRNENISVQLVTTSTAVRVILNTVSQLPPQTVRVSLLFDAIHLSHLEQYLFRSRKGELLYQRMQHKVYPFAVNEHVLSCLLDFTGTANYLIVSAFVGSFKKLDTFTLIINGVVIGEPDTSTDVYRYFNNTLCTTRNLYVIPFALNCHNPQPSGSLTFFGRKNTLLVVKRNDTSFTCDVQITAVMLDSLIFNNGVIA